MTDQQPDSLDPELASHLRQRSDEIILPAPDPEKPASDARRATRRRVGAGVGAMAVTLLAVGGLTMINDDEGGDELASEAADVEAVDEESVAEAESAVAVPSSGLSFGGGSAAAAFGLEGDGHLSSLTAIDGGWLAVLQRWNEEGPGGSSVELLYSTDGQNWEPGPGPDTGPNDEIQTVVVEGDLMVATGASYPEGFFDVMEEPAGSSGEPFFHTGSPTPKVWVSTDGGGSWSSSELAKDQPDLPDWAVSNLWIGNATINGSTIMVTGSTYVDINFEALLGEDAARPHEHGYGWGSGPDGEFQLEVWSGDGEPEPEYYTADELGIDPSVVSMLGQHRTVIWSTSDGADWEKQDGPEGVTLEQIVSGSGGLYSIGYPQGDEFALEPVAEEEFYGSSLWRSTDGSSWSEVEGLPTDGETFIQQVFEFGDDIAIVTEEWPNGPTLWRFDGQTWHREPLGDMVTVGEEEQLWFEQVQSGPAGTLVIANVETQMYGPEPLVDEIVIEKDGLVLRQPVHGRRDESPPDVFATIEDAAGNVLAEYSFDEEGPDGPSAGMSWEEGDDGAYYSVFSDPETGEELLRITDREMEEAWQQVYPEELYEEDYVPPRRLLLWRSAGATQWEALDQEQALGFTGWTQAAAVGDTEVMIVLQEELDEPGEMPAIYEELDQAMQALYEQFEAGEITEEELMEAEEALWAEWEPRMAEVEASMPQPETHIFVGTLD
ncbi:MAG: exo-alpha-sialidase [Actinomycetia bacterium]|nr:exo-alpha-sialidase [Actinomycetes bacterium]